MPAELQNCPWCKTDYAEMKIDGHDFYVQCQTCNLSGPYCESEDAACDVWNSLGIDKKKANQHSLFDLG